MRLRSALVALTASSVALAPAAAQADLTDGPTPGAPGIGDPYFPLDGNGGYDVQHYDLDVAYDPATDVLEGTATIRARATQALSQFNLDLEGLTVRSVTVDRQPATWSRAGGELTVVPARALREGRRFVVEVVYDGVPQTLEDELGTSGFLHTDDGALAVGQPDVAATWFPANDHPSDAATVDVSVTVPADLEAISNGRLVRQSTRRGQTTWEWRASEPMATYLVVLAVGQFEVREYRDGTSRRRYVDALDPDLYAPVEGGPSRGEIADEVLARQPEIIDFLAELFGPYPHRSAGAIIDDDERLMFALETQTRPIYGPVFFDEPTFAELVVVHEYAHTWFGNQARLERWQDIWLNEGFASYAEWLWQEAQGTATAQELFDERLALPADHPLWEVEIGDPGSAIEQLFHPAVYERGAMTLHALRVEIGDDAFFTLLRTWADTQAGGTYTTQELIDLAEEVSGQQLDELFQTWVYTAGKPG